MTTKQWNVQITISEGDRETRAEATLVEPGARQLTASGTARRNPHDRPVPMIGDELATARALSNLAHQLLDTAASDIESVTHQQAHLTH
jgi:Domain of unknown function (DUF1876)